MRVFRCGDDGAVLRGATVGELIATVEAHLVRHHTVMAGRLSAKEILAMSVEERPEAAGGGVMSTTQIDEAKLEAFVGQVITDAGGAIGVLLSYIGDKLGLYKALSELGPATPSGLAERTGTNERMIREWLSQQAAGGYVTYDPAAGTFTLPPEHAVALADESHPAFVSAFFQGIWATYQDIERKLEAVRTGKGLAWGDHHPELFHATERLFRPGYEAEIVQQWIPALEGVEEKLRRGALVADVGAGHGVSTIVMAKAYPNSRFVGFDFHAPSIERARKLAAEAGVADRVTFEVATAQEFPGSGYDLVALFDCLHDMGRPDLAVRHARETLAPDGTVLLVEPFAGDRLEDNLTPLGRAFYGFSSLVCTPSSLSEDGLALGAQAGPARTGALFTDAGYGTFRVATQTAINIVYEAKP